MNTALNKKIATWLVVIISVLLPFREILSYFLVDWVKFIPDILVWFFALYLIIYNKFKFHFDSFDYAFLFFVAIGIFSSVIGGRSLLALGLQVRSIGTMYVLFYILRQIKLDRREYLRIVHLLMAVSIFLILGSFIEYFSDKAWFYPKEWADSILYPINFARTYSLMKNPNTFGAFSFFVMFLVYTLTKEQSTVWYKIYYGLVFLSILLTASRSTLILLGLFLVYLFIKCVRRRQYLSIVSMGLIFAISFGTMFAFNGIKAGIQAVIAQQETAQKAEQVIPPEVSDQASQESSVEENVQDAQDTIVEPEKNSDDTKQDTPTVHSTSTKKQESPLIQRIKDLFSTKILKQSAADGRVFSIFTGLIILLDHPVLGTGFGTYGSAGSRMVTPSALYEQYGLFEGFYSDNEYITVLVETGLVGAFVLLGFAVLLFRFYRKEPKKVFLLLCVLLTGMFYNILELQVLCFVVYLFLSCPIDNPNE